MTTTNELRNELDRLSVAELQNQIASLQTAVNLREEQAARLKGENEALRADVRGISAALGLLFGANNECIAATSQREPVDMNRLKVAYQRKDRAMAVAAECLIHARAAGYLPEEGRP